MPTKQFMEYMSIHLISLNQDYEKFYDEYLDTREYDSSKIDDIRGQIKATRHLMSVASDMIRLPIERI
jgi:DNA-binding phage protein